jgi:hypothetical protein
VTRFLHPTGQALKQGERFPAVPGVGWGGAPLSKVRPCEILDQNEMVSVVGPKTVAATLRREPQVSSEVGISAGSPLHRETLTLLWPTPRVGARGARQSPWREHSLPPGR